MRKLNFTLFTGILLATLVSCGGSSSQEANAKGFDAIQKEITSKFTDQAYFTDLSIVNGGSSVGNIISVTVTEDPESLKMGQWNLMQNVWKQNSEITLEISDGSKAVDFMFQLDDKINLKKLGELTEKSITSLKEEKDLKNPKMSMASVNFPDNGDISKAEYLISLEPENGGTSFTYRYKLDGELIDMDY